MAASLKKHDRVWCWGFSGILILLTTLPYLVGFASQGESWRFTGFVFAVEDGNSYIAKMMLGARGDWLFRTPYTSLPQEGVLAYLPYLLLGKLAAPPALHEQLVVLYHLFRSLAIPVAVFAVYSFVSVFTERRFWRRWVVVLATIGGGLGWLLVLLDSLWLEGMPLDFYSPEAFGFLSLFGLPHLAMARALLMLALAWFLRSYDDPVRAWMAGGALLLLTLMQPITIVAAYAVLCVYLLAVGVQALRDRSSSRWKTWFACALRAGAPALPLVIYYVVSFRTDPFLRTWTAQNRILSPDPWHYFFAYALILVPAVFGVAWVVREGHEEGLLPTMWALILPLLAYAPHNLQRRFPDGVWVALLVLAALGIEKGVHLNELWKRRLQLGLLTLSLPTSLLLIWGGLDVARHPAQPAFRPSEEVAAFLWLADHATPGDLALCSFQTGNALPAWAPMYVVIGHGPESAHFSRFERQVESIFKSVSLQPEEMSLLQDWGVDWIWLGPNERKLGSWEPSQEGMLSLQYDMEPYEIYFLYPDG